MMLLEPFGKKCKQLLTLSSTFLCDILANKLIFWRKRSESRLKISKMPYGKYLPEGKTTSTRLLRNAAKEEPPRRPHHGQPDTRDPEERGTISGAPGRTRPPARPSRAPRELPHGGHCSLYPICLRPGHGPCPRGNVSTAHKADCVHPLPPEGGFTEPLPEHRV